MCGFVAISSFPSSLKTRLDESLKAIAHRGPDSHGTFQSDSGDCSLGHVRLSILDTSSAGTQPMIDQSGRYVIAYNGETYNFIELKSELESKYGPIQWCSHSDTEVVLEGFAREGKRFLQKLNGTFSLAIYDKGQKELFVLRDPLGVKPLFIREIGGSLNFASELKALLKLDLPAPDFRVEAFKEMLAFMYVPEPRTIYEGIFKAAPGELLRCKDGRITDREILTFDLLSSEGAQQLSENEYVERLRTSFLGAVERQLVSDVPIALMLSGGLDSSAVAYAAKHAGTKISEAYTISFSKESLKRDYQSDDLKYAQLVSDDLGINLNVIPAELNFEKLIPNLTYFFEDGYSDPAAFNTYLICQAARANGIKVMLTGQGADEYLCGYRRYQAEALLAKMPESLRGVVGSLDTFIPENMTGRLNAVSRRLKKFTRASRLEESDRWLSLYTWGAPIKVASLFKEQTIPQYESEFKRHYELIKSRGFLGLEAMIEMDKHYDLLSLNLTYCDRMSMAAGVEARVPILDFDLVKLMNKIPVSLKLKAGVGKTVLKKAMEGIVPNEVIYREKAGFFSPINYWLEAQQDSIRNQLLNQKNYLHEIMNLAEIGQLVEDHFSKKSDQSKLIFTLIIIDRLTRGSM